MKTRGKPKPEDFSGHQKMSQILVVTLLRSNESEGGLKENEGIFIFIYIE